MQNYHLFYASRNWTASPRQLSSKHQEENERQEGQTSLAEDSGGRKETTKTKLEYPPPPQEMAKDQQEWRTLIAALHAKGATGSK